MSTSVWPHRRQPTRLPCPWDSPGKNTGVGCHSLLQCMKVKSESEDAQSYPTLSDPMDCSLPTSMGFSRQEYRSRVPLPSPSLSVYYLNWKMSKLNNAICSNIDGPRNCHTKWSKSGRARQISCDMACLWNLKNKDTNELIYKTEIQSQM